MPCNQAGKITYPVNINGGTNQLKAGKPPSIIAQGLFDNNKSRLDVDKLTVTYKVGGSGATKTIKGLLIGASFPSWNVLFSDDGLKAANNPFTLIIFNHAADCLSEDFTVMDAPAAPRSGPKLRMLNTLISGPTTPATVPPTFSCWGTTDSPNPVFGNLLDGNNNVYPGTTTYDQNPVWVVQFSNIPPGTYTLTIVAQPDYTSSGPFVVAPPNAG